MNQGRISPFALFAGILMMYVSGGYSFVFNRTGEPARLAVAICTLVLGVGILRSIYRTANAWSWNVTPQNTFKLPEGSWMVVGQCHDRGWSPDDTQPFVYLTICQRENNDAGLTRGIGYSTLELTPQILQWEDYQRLLRREKPLRIYIAQNRIGFEWPKKSGLHNVLA